VNYARVGRKEFESLLNLRMRPVDIEWVMRAYKASKLGHGHKNQLRENGERYFEHPKRVALILMRELGVYDRDMIISALLHDIVEDTYIFGARDEAYSNLQGEFRRRVATFVMALSKEPCGLEEKLERDRRYFEGIVEEGPKTMLLKLSDRLDNLRDLHGCSVAKKQHYVEETEEKILPLALYARTQFSGDIKRNVTRVQKEMVAICERTKLEIADQ